MHTYPLLQHKYKQKCAFQTIPVLHMYILFTTTLTLTQTNNTSLTCEHTLYKNTKINTNACCQNTQYYMCTYPLQQHKHKHKVPKITIEPCCKNYQSYMRTYPLQQHEHFKKVLLVEFPFVEDYIPYTTIQELKKSCC